MSVAQSDSDSIDAGKQFALPGRADGHRFVVFKIDIENGREQLGEEIASPQTLDRAMEIASRP